MSLTHCGLWQVHYFRYSLILQAYFLSRIGYIVNWSSFSQWLLFCSNILLSMYQLDVSHRWSNVDCSRLSASGSTILNPHNLMYQLEYVSRGNKWDGELIYMSYCKLLIKFVKLLVFIEVRVLVVWWWMNFVKLSVTFLIIVDSLAFYFFNHLKLSHWTIYRWS